MWQSAPGSAQLSQSRLLTHPRSRTRRGRSRALSNDPEVQRREGPGHDAVDRERLQGEGFIYSDPAPDMRFLDLRGVGPPLGD